MVYCQKQRKKVTHLLDGSQKKLEEKSQLGADDFVEFLRDFEKKGYLDFQGHNKRQVFHTLRAELPMMKKYGESNFYAYF